jgi:hypothetical protein
MSISRALYLHVCLLMALKHAYFCFANNVHCASTSSRVFRVSFEFDI